MPTEPAPHAAATQRAAAIDRPREGVRRVRADVSTALLGPPSRAASHKHSLSYKKRASPAARRPPCSSPCTRLALMRAWRATGLFFLAGLAGLSVREPRSWSWSRHAGAAAARWPPPSSSVDRAAGTLEADGRVPVSTGGPGRAANDLDAAPAIFLRAARAARAPCRRGRCDAGLPHRRRVRAAGLVRLGLGCGAGLGCGRRAV